MEVSLQEILAARERRAEKQRRLLSEYGCPLLCFTMNIAGPIKCDKQILWGFALGNRWIEAQFADLPILHREKNASPTGCEAFYVIDTLAETAKRRAVQIEDSAPVARLFDLDVLEVGGKKLERTELGFSRRTCLLCDKPAHICGRSRAHDLTELQAKTDQLLQEAMVQEDCSHIGRLAQQSLLFEVCTTPKPGLVDCRNQGSHQDMDIFTFLSSATALAPYFVKCAKIGATTRSLSPKQVLAQLRFMGKLAEQDMYQATAGVNTHKGSIFILGILCAAAGRLEPSRRQPENILSLCKAMAQDLVQEDLQAVTLDNATTAGERLYAQYGIGGVRQQAQSGFPQILQVGLPVLKEGLRAGHNLHEAGCAALLALLSATTDTNLIHRSSLLQQQKVAADIKMLLQRDPYPSRELLEQLDDRFIAANLSPGGSADLLAATYFLYFLTLTMEETL